MCIVCLPGRVNNIINCSKIIILLRVFFREKSEIASINSDFYLSSVLYFLTPSLSCSQNKISNIDATRN